MTVYSQRAERGEAQILATYRSSVGLASTTVATVGDAALAAPVVDALNRVSAWATAPVSVYDNRNEDFESYPKDHLAALTDREARPALRRGAHSLWYAWAANLLHHALADLDAALAAVPAPAREAVEAEVAAEARALLDELAEFSEGVEPPDRDRRRFWKFEAPFLSPDAFETPLDEESREVLDHLESGADEERRARAADALRLLQDAHSACANDSVRLMPRGFDLFDDPDDDDDELRYFLRVVAPTPTGKPDQADWRVVLCRWVPVEPEVDVEDHEDEYDDDLDERPVLTCALPGPPALSEVVGLLNLSAGGSEVLAAWAETPVGDPLEGTAFVVTEHHEDDDDDDDDEEDED